MTNPLSSAPPERGTAQPNHVRISPWSRWWWMQIGAIIAAPVVTALFNVVAEWPRTQHERSLITGKSFSPPALDTSMLLAVLAVVATVVVALAFPRKEVNLSAPDAIDAIRDKRGMADVVAMIGFSVSTLTLVYGWEKFTLIWEPGVGNQRLWEGTLLVVAGQAVALATVFSQSTRTELGLLASVELPVLQGKQERLTERWEKRWKVHVEQRVGTVGQWVAALFCLLLPVVAITAVSEVIEANYGTNPVISTSASLAIAFSLMLSYFVALGSTKFAGVPGKATYFVLATLQILIVVAMPVAALVVQFQSPILSPFMWTIATTHVILAGPFAIPSFPRSKVLKCLLIYIFWHAYVIRQQSQANSFLRRQRDIDQKELLLEELERLHSSSSPDRLNRSTVKQSLWSRLLHGALPNADT